MGLETGMENVTDDIREMKDDVRAIRNQYSARPSWAVSVIITILSSASVGLAVALATTR